VFVDETMSKKAEKNMLRKLAAEECRHTPFLHHEVPDCNNAVVIEMSRTFVVV